MNFAEVVDIGQTALSTTIVIAVPVMAIAMATGLLIALFQALTQIQEMTLTFVPKIVVIMMSLIVLLPFMVSTLLGFAEGLYDRIAAFGLAV